MENVKLEVEVLKYPNITEDQIEQTMYTLAYQTYEEYYPDALVAPKSVNVGELYESNNSYSCQIRFTMNGVICKCKFIKDTSEYEIEFYELTHLRKGKSIRHEGNEMCFLLTGDNIEERKQKDLEDTSIKIKRAEEKKRKAEEKKKRAEEKTPRRSMQRTERKSKNT